MNMGRLARLSGYATLTRPTVSCPLTLPSPTMGRGLDLATALQEAG